MKDSLELLEFQLRKMVSSGTPDVVFAKESADGQMVGFENTGNDGRDGFGCTYQ